MSNDILPDRKESKLLNVCGLWKCTSLSGNPYLRGKMGNAVVLIMPNRFKTQENQPDLILYLAPPVQKDREDKKPDTAGFPYDDPPAERTSEAPATSLDDDLPF